MILVLVPLVIAGLLAGANGRWRSRASGFSGFSDPVSLEQRVLNHRKAGVLKHTLAPRKSAITALSEIKNAAGLQPNETAPTEAGTPQPSSRM